MTYLPSRPSSVQPLTSIVGDADTFQVSQDGKTYVTATFAELKAYAKSVVAATGATGGSAGGTGPVASSSFLTVDFSAPTGIAAPAALWGVAAAAPNNDHFIWCDNPTFLTAATKIMPALYRINCNSGNGGAGISETGFWSLDIFVNGVGSPNWNVTKKFTDNAYRFISPTCRLIIGLMFESKTGDGTFAYNLTDWKAVCTAMANQFSTVKGLDGKPLNIYGWEIGNETNGRISDPDYNSYFVAAADAFHAVNPNWVIIGPTWSFMPSAPAGGITSWGNAVGSRKVACCWHRYLYGLNAGAGNLVSDADLFTTNLNALDADNCRSSLASTPAANVDFFMGEWNIDFAALQPGETRQQQGIGAPFAAKWIVDAFKAHKGFTMGAIWEMLGDGQYGIIREDFSIDAEGWLLARAGRVMGGNEVSSTFGSSGLHVCLPVMNQGNVGVMIVNWDTAAISGQVALSQWPINSSGTGTLTRFEVGVAQPQGADSTIGVTSGITDVLTVPARSVVILHT